MRFALNSLAIIAGDWLLALSLPEWVDRYGHRIEESRLPRSQEDRQAVRKQVATLLVAAARADGGQNPEWG